MSYHPLENMSKEREISEKDMKVLRPLRALPWANKMLWNEIVLGRLATKYWNDLMRLWHPTIDEAYEKSEVAEFYTYNDCDEAKLCLEEAEVRLRTDKALRKRVRELERAHRKEVRKLEAMYSKMALDDEEEFELPIRIKTRRKEAAT